MQSKIIDKLTCRPISATSNPKYSRYLPAHFCTLVNIYNVTTKRTIGVNITSHYPLSVSPTLPLAVYEYS